MSRRRRSLIGTGPLPSAPPESVPRVGDEPISDASLEGAPVLDLRKRGADPTDRQNLADTGAVALPPELEEKLRRPAATPKPAPSVEPSVVAPATRSTTEPLHQDPSPKPSLSSTPPAVARSSEGVLPRNFGPEVDDAWFTATPASAPRASVSVDAEIVVKKTSPVLYGIVLLGLGVAFVAGLGILALFSLLS